MKCGRTGIICASLVAAGLLTFATGASAATGSSGAPRRAAEPAAAQVEDSSSSESDAPLWIGIATGLGAAAALGFALWPAWKRTPAHRPAPSEPPSSDTSAVDAPTTESPSAASGSSRWTEAEADRARELDALISQARARLRSAAAETSEQQARSLERVAAQQTQAFLGSASAVRAELAVLVREWQTELEASVEKVATSSSRGGASQPEVARLRVASEAFERLRRVQREALNEIGTSRQEGLAALEASRVEVERLSRQYTHALDEAGAQWLRRIEKAGSRGGRRRGRVSPPIVGVVVAVGIVIGAVAFAVGGDNERSGAGPKLRAESGASVDSTVPTSTTSVATTAPLPSTTTPATTTPVTATQPPRTTPQTPATSPPVANIPPPQTSPPAVTPPSNFPPPPTFPVFVCQYVPAFC